MKIISNEAYEAAVWFGDDKLKEIATEFFYWWHNQPGSNTEQGFDEWWKLQQRCVECGARTPEEAETKCICGGDKDHCHGQELWPD